MKIFICGDSTAASYDPKETLMTGWGQVLGEYLPEAEIRNHAMAGRSTRTFLQEGRLERVMEEIGEQMLRAVPERELPTTREEFWDVMWWYRQRELAFFTSHASLGRVLIVSLGAHDLDAEDLVALCPPIGRIVQRQTRLFHRGQELGAVRGDLEVGVIFRLLRGLDRSLCLHFFGLDVGAIERLDEGERRRRLQGYDLLFRDLAQRMLEPCAPCVVDFKEAI